MSIKAIARDVYKAQQRVDGLQKEYDASSGEEKNDVGVELKFAQKELSMLRKMLDGEKESGAFRKRFDGFGNSKR
ncbi:MAG: hypothetical protein GY702_25350 [Desulfobulbaceae bacterium]|nr:hypothetical protein [Desulfobulbaceae bacterium]